MSLLYVNSPCRHQISWYPNMWAQVYKEYFNKETFTKNILTKFLFTKNILTKNLFTKNIMTKVVWHAVFLQCNAHPMQNLLRKARKEGLIQNDWFAHVLIKEVILGNLLQFDTFFLSFLKFSSCEAYVKFLVSRWTTWQIWTGCWSVMVGSTYPSSTHK